MVLDGDPRKDIDILLDTKTHATFAIRKGEIVRNTFVTITEESPEEKRRSEQGWLAYAPPPLAVPMDYQDTSKWNRFDSKYVSGIGVGVVALDRQHWEGQDSDSRDQVGDLTDFEGGEIRVFRVGGVGTINFDRPWIWTMFAATHAFDKGFDSDDDDDWTLFDLRLDIPIWEKTGFSIGKQKEPISMERIMPLTYSPQQERAAVSDAMLPARNIGVVMSGTLLEDRMTFAGGIFNNWLDKHQPKSIDDNATQFIGRITAVPWMSPDTSTLLHLGAGYRYSNAREETRALAEPEFKQAPVFVDTGLFDADELNTYQAEISLRSGPYWLHGEYLMGELDAPSLGDPDFNGYHLTASWVVTGEMRAYNKRVGIFDRYQIARDVNQNGWGAWELSTRFSSLDLNDGNIRGGEMDILSAGVNWWNGLPSYWNRGNK
jgi:phosphate-selective porin OprO/OprP